MADGKDRSRIEAVLDRSIFDIAAIKTVVDQIYNETPTPTPEEDEMAKIATKNYNILNDVQNLRTYGEAVNKNYVRYIFNSLAEAVTYEDLPRSTVVAKFSISGNKVITGDYSDEYPVTLNFDYVFNNTDFRKGLIESDPIVKQYGYGFGFSNGSSYDENEKATPSTFFVTSSITTNDRVVNVNDVPLSFIAEGPGNREILGFQISEILSATLTVDVYLAGKPSTGDKISSEVYFNSEDFSPYESESSTS